MEQKVFVSNGLKGPHVYTSIAKLFKGVERVFPVGAEICAMDHPILEFSLENLQKALSHWKYVKVRDKTHYVIVSQVWLDDEMPNRVSEWKLDINAL